MKHFICAAAVGLLLALFSAGSGNAANLQISGTSFVLRCPCDNEPPANSEFGEESQGLLLNARGKYFASVPLPGNGNICGFGLVYRDNDGDNNLTAALNKKPWENVGAFDPPIEMASVSSKSASNGIRRAFTRDITQPAANTNQAFFYVEVTVPFEALEVLGVQVDFRTGACP